MSQNGLNFQWQTDQINAQCISPLFTRVGPTRFLQSDDDAKLKIDEFWYELQFIICLKGTIAK